MDKILVKETEFGVHEYVFPSYRWIESVNDKDATATIKCAGKYLPGPECDKLILCEGLLLRCSR